jgi:hypothetical protein
LFLKGSRHIPPRAEALQHAMPALFDLLEVDGVASELINGKSIP